jgi:hypothetical protein
MAFELPSLGKMLVLAGLAWSCASRPVNAPAPEPEADCRQTSPNLVHVLKTVAGPLAKKDSYEFCVSREGDLLFERGLAPTHRARVSDEQIQSLKAVLARASQRQGQEVAHTCTHSRSLLVEWIWSGKSFAAHEACDDTQPVVANEIRDAAWKILRLESVKAPKR